MNKYLHVVIVISIITCIIPLNAIAETSLTAEQAKRILESGGYLPKNSVVTGELEINKWPDHKTLRLSGTFEDTVMITLNKPAYNRSINNTRRLSKR